MSDISDKEKLIQDAFDKLKSETKNIQIQIYSAIWKFILENYGKNPTLNNLSKINKELKKILTKKTFKIPVEEYLKTFDDIELLTKRIIGGEIDIDLKDLNLSAEKKLMVEDITNGLLNEEMLQNNLHQPLRKMLYRYSTTNVSLKQIEDELSNFILSNDEGLGFAEKYVHTLAVESLSQFDGMINQRVAQAYDLDAFRIVGSLIKTSEPQCIQMVHEIGELGKYAVNGKYASKDLDKIIPKLKANYRGVHKDLNSSNYFIYRNHYGCRHTFIPTRLLDKDIAILKNRDNMD